MKSFLPFPLSVLLLPAGIFAQTSHPQAIAPAIPTPAVKSTSATAKAAIAADYGKLPLSFEANRGQADAQVKFLSRGNGYALFLTDKAAVLELSKSGQPKADKSKYASRVNGPAAARELARSRKTDVIRMELAGASQSAQVVGAEQLPGTANYFLGSDSSKWHTNVPTYARVKYTGVYPGVDLVYYGNQSQLEYDFVVAPKADPKAVQLHFAGAEKLKLAANGDLVIAAKDGEIAFHKPVVYQMKTGQKAAAGREAVEARFTLLADNTVGFALGGYDHSRELVIDPTLAYSTFLANESYPGRIAVDSSGSAYLVGSAIVAGYPLPSGDLNDAGSAGQAVFVAKFNPSGSALAYSALFNADNASGIAVDAAGDAYVVGDNYSSDYLPVTAGVVQPANHGAALGAPNAFVLKLNPQGSALLFATYLGGSGVSGSSYAYGDLGSSIAVDGSENVYVTGIAYSTDFPVTGDAFQKTNKAAANRASNGFIAKLNANATALVYSTYLGGSGTLNIEDNPFEGEGAGTLAIDSSGNAYIAGSTTSSDFPVTEGVLQTTSPGGAGFVTKLNPAGSGLLYSTYLGPNATSVHGLTLDAAGDAYVTGYTQPGFPVTSNAFQKTPPTAAPTIYGGSGGVFVAKLNPQASGLVYSTYLGGVYYNNFDNDFDSGNDIAVDSSGDAYIAGTAVSIGFPLTRDAYQPVTVGSASFLAELNPAGSALLYSTLLGGSEYGDYASGLALDSSRGVYMTGFTDLKGFPTTPGSFQPTAPSGSFGLFVGGAYVAKFNFAATSLIPTTTVLTTSANPSILGQPVTFTAKVTPTTGSGNATGTVSFLFPSFPKTVTVPIDGAGHAALQYHSPNPQVTSYSSYPVGAVYNGNSTYALSSGSLIQTFLAPPPVFSVASGTSSSTPLTVYISDSTNSGEIKYTTDGSDPSTSSTAVRYAGPILVASTETIRAYAFVTTPDIVGSAVVSAAYTITSPLNLIQFPQGFSSSAGLISPLVDPPNVQPPALDLNGIAYYQTPLPIQSFTTDFTFQLTSNNSGEPLSSLADGFTFVIQNAGPKALSTDNNGGGLAYAGIMKSVAVKFDLHNNAGEGTNSTGLYIDGAEPTVPAVNLTGTGINLHSGDLFAAHVTYDGAILFLTIADTKTKASYTHSFPVDIPGTVGGTTAYVGFTGRFAYYVNPYLLSWTYVPGPIDFPDGFGIGSLEVIQNGKAKVSGTALELTDGGQFETTSAFYSTPVNVQSFASNFSFQQTNPNADGITFTIQNAGTTALGLHGGSLGYQGIGKSVAIKFDLHDDAGEGDNSTGIYIDGAAPTVPSITLNGGSGINLKNGHIFNANLAYDGSNLVLTITDTVTKKAFTHSFPINIPATVGGNTAYVGFTGATGFDTATQEILTWTFTNP